LGDGINTAASVFGGHVWEGGRGRGCEIGGDGRTVALKQCWRRSVRKEKEKTRRKEREEEEEEEKGRLGG
jgi:hypothetical protein